MTSIQVHSNSSQPTFGRRCCTTDTLIPGVTGTFFCCDDYRFINHSNTPNVRVDAAEDFYGVDFAARDIDTGEELTVDYGIVEGARRW